MSAHAFWATSGCQLLSLVGERVSHQMTTPPKRIATAPTLRQNGLTNTSTAADASARSPATILFALPNGASNHTAPNAQAIAMMAIRRTSSAPTQRMTCTRFFITAVRNPAARGDITIHGRRATRAARVTSSTFASFNSSCAKANSLHRPRLGHGDDQFEHDSNAHASMRLGVELKN